jgi:integrase
LKGFAVADDYEETNGNSVLTYWMAQDRARAIARAGEGPGDRPATVAEAVDAYEADLKARGAAVKNATHIRFNLTDTLAAKPVALLTSKELRAWRNSLVKGGMKPASADRVGGVVLKAALNLAASDDARIVNSKAWKVGLKRLPDDDEPRNTILPDDIVRAVIRTAYDVDPYLGVWIETLAGTGARESQVVALKVADLQDDPTAPRLMMPCSRKGRNRRIERRPLPISPRLAAVLRQATTGRAKHAPLLEKIPQIYRPFRIVTGRLGLDPALTPYCLRHSSIVRRLLAGIPTRLVAAAHDTSVAILEAVYSRYIVGDLSDTMMRRSLLDTVAPAPTPNVVPIGRKS